MPYRIFWRHRNDGKICKLLVFLLPWTKWGSCLGCSSEEWVLGGDVVNACRPIRTVWDLAAVGYDAATTSAHCRREIEHTVVGKPLGWVTLVSHRLKKKEIEMRLSHTVLSYTTSAHRGQNRGLVVFRKNCKNHLPHFASVFETGTVFWRKGNK